MRARLFCAVVLAACSASCGSSSSSIEVSAPTGVKCQVSAGTAGSTNVPSDGGTGVVSVTTTRDCTWTATSNASWLTLTSAASGQGSGTVTYRATQNPDAVQRHATVDVNNTQLTISQDAAPCRFAVSPASAAEPTAGGNLTVTIATLSACPWTAVSRVPWITMNGATSGTGTGSISLRVAANSGADRTGTVAIADQVVSVTQSAPAPTPTPTPTPAPTPTPTPCTFSISPTSKSVTAAGGSDKVTVTASATTCVWTAKSNVEWVVITSGLSGTGNGTVQYTVAANISISARTGTITAAGQTFTIDQGAVSHD